MVAYTILTTLVSFNGSDGFEPIGGLIADANGDLFGTTQTGGAYGYGTVFEIVNNGTAAAPSYANTPVTLVSFNGTDGGFPQGSLIADANGDLFGTTSQDGAYGDGTVFEIVNNGTAAARATPALPPPWSASTTPTVRILSSAPSSSTPTATCSA